MKKKVLIVGAGPGGLTAGMILASSGYDVEVFEKQPFIGGRTSLIEMGDYTFDTAPTFLMMKFILEEMFELTGRNIEDYLTIKEVHPMYRLVFHGGKTFFPTRDREKMREQIKGLFPQDVAGYDRFMTKEKAKYEALLKVLQVPYSSYLHYFRRDFLECLPKLDGHTSLIKRLASYFTSRELQIAFTFQAKYLGMSPWECPASYSIISYIEHAMGIHHVQGGFGQITRAMARVIEEEGGKVHLSLPVSEIVIENNRAIGLRLENGETVKGDDVIINGDFAYSMTSLVGKEHRRKYTDKALAKKKYSCSTFMLYLGVDKRYDLDHHNILFARDYKQNVDEISKHGVLSEDPSVYVQNAVVTDPSLAPANCSSLYVLAPVTNNFAGIDWNKEAPRYREVVLKVLEEKGGLKDLRKHIQVEKMITPFDWEHTYNVYKGATFNLAHNIGQMLTFRPHNRFEEFANCFLVGGGTHPGSGLPTIFESGRITASLIVGRDGVVFPHGTSPALRVYAARKGTRSM